MESGGLLDVHDNSKADKTNQKKGVRQGALELPRFYKDLFRQENNLIMDEIYRVAVYNSCIEYIQIIRFFVR